MTTHIYVIGSGNGPFKIGVAKSPAARLVSLQTGHPEQLELIATWESDRATVVERKAHKLLASHRTQGEWFAISADQAIKVVEQILAFCAVGKVDKSKHMRRKEAGYTVAKSNRYEEMGIGQFIAELVNRIGMDGVTEDVRRRVIEIEAQRIAKS